MASAPIDDLPDDAFLDAPLGFRSEAGKSQLTMSLLILGGILFLMQMILPQVLNFLFLPGFGSPNPFPVNFGDFSEATVYQDAIWHPVFDAMSGPNSASKLIAVTKTGEALDRSVEMPFDPVGLVAEGDRLWAVGSLQLAMIEDDKPLVVHPARTLEDPSLPFLRNGQLHVIDRSRTTGDFQLLAFEQGEWLDRGLLLWPVSLDLPADALAPENPEIDPEEFLQQVQQRPLSFGGTPPREMWTVGQGDALITMATDQATISHSGFPSTFIQNVSGTPRFWFHRGLPATGASANIEGWTELPWPKGEPAPGVGELAPAFVVLSGQLHLLRVAGDGQSGAQIEVWKWASQNDSDTALWQQVQTQPLTAVRSIYTLATEDPQEWLVLCETLTGGTEFLQIGSTGTLESLSTGTNSLIGQVYTMYGPFYLAMTLFSLSMLLIWGIGADLLMRGYRSFEFRRGKTTYRLATLWRRGVARMIDLWLVGLPNWIITIYVWQTVDLNKFVVRFLEDWTKGLVEVLGLLAVIGIATLLGMIVLIFWEAYWGCSPGKLLCGLRVIRKTTLKPPGLLRAAARQILLIGDMFFNFLPGVLLIGLTQDQQRLGDLAGDTIVLNARSLKAAD